MEFSLVLVLGVRHNPLIFVVRVKVSFSKQRNGNIIGIQHSHLTMLLRSITI